MTLTERPRPTAPLAAGLFGGAPNPKRRDEPLAGPPAKDSGDKPGSRRRSFSDLFRADDGQLHAACF